MNVLVVDDSDIIRAMILKSLRLAGVPVSAAFEAANGRQALAVLEDEWVDVVLTDINMPIMNGLDLVRAIRADDTWDHVVIIVVSTERAAARRKELASSGMNAFLPKPFTPEQIRDVFRDATVDLTPEGFPSSAEAAFGEVLQRFVFMDWTPAGPAGSVPDELDGELLQARMTFTGQVSGALVMTAPRELCLDMAVNALGTDPDSPEADRHAADALGEVLNMTCGCLVMALEPERATNLRPPAVVCVAADAWADLAAATTTRTFIIEDRPALLSCHLRIRC